MNLFKTRNYYEVVGIDRNASKAQIKLAYRRLAKKNHLDKNKQEFNAKEKFIEIHEAYEILNDPRRRAQYDNIGSTKLFIGINSEVIYSTQYDNDFDFGRNFVNLVSKYFKQK